MLKNVKSRIREHSPQVLKKLLGQISNSEIAKRIIRASFWSIANTLFIRFFALLSTVLVARIIGKEAYGELGIINSTIGMYGTFAGFGLSVTTIKYVAEYVKKDPEKVSKIITLSNLFSIFLGLAFTLCLFLMSEWLSVNTLSAPNLTWKLQLSSTLIVLYSWNGVQVGILSGFESFKTMAKIGVITGIISITLIIGGAIYFDIFGVLMGMILTQTITCLLYGHAIVQECDRKGIKCWNKRFWEEKRALVTFTLPSFLSGMVISPVNWTANAFLVKSTNGFSEMGIFAAVERISSISIALMTPISQALLPIIVSKFSEQSGKSKQKIEIFNISISWIIGLLIIMPIIAYPEITAFLFGDEYQGKNLEKTIVILLFSTAILAHRQGIARSFIARSLLWISVISNLLWGGIVVVASYFLTDLGAQGRALAILLGYVINTLIFLPVYIKYDLAPRVTLNSREAITIWGALIVLSLATYLELGILIRTISLIMCITVVIICFKRILQIEE